MGDKIFCKKFINTLKNIRPGLCTGKEVIQHSSSFIFKKGKVTTCNDYIAVTSFIDVDWECAIPAKELYNLLIKIPDKEVDCIVKENHLEITGTSFSASISLEKDLELLSDSIPYSKKWNILPKNFTDAISICLYAASDDITDSTLTCLHFTNSQVESCDNFRISQCLFEGVISDSFLIPSVVCQDIIKYSPIEYCLSDSWVQFKMEDGSILSCRSAEGDFPDLSAIIDDGNYCIVSFPKEISKILERAEVMSSKNLNGALELKIKILKEKIEIKGEGVNGWYKESIEITSFNDNPIEFVVNSEFLKYVLQYSQSIELDIDNSKLRFTSPEFTHIVALIK